MKEIKIEAPKGKVIQQEETDNGIVVRFVDEEQDILVPEEINIIKVGAHRLGIVNRNQVLYYFNKGNWSVHITTERRELKHKLVKYEWEDLKVGDVFYCSDSDLEDIEDLGKYKVKFDDEFYAFWCDNSVAVKDFPWKYYYKVVPI